MLLGNSRCLCRRECLIISTIIKTVYPIMPKVKDYIIEIIEPRFIGYLINSEEIALLLWASQQQGFFCVT